MLRPGSPKWARPFAAVGSRSPLAHASEITMPPTQLRCRDLAPGDILLKVRVDKGSWSSWLISHGIQLGQRATGRQNVHITHAGVLFEKTFIIEALSAGISASDLRVQNLTYGYQVFRCANADMAAGAGTCAKMMFDINQNRGSLPYTVPGAFRSLLGSSGRPPTPGEMNGLLDRILEGKGQSFFCSQFVTYVYQFVAEQSGVAARKVFNVSDAKVPPATLATALVGHPLFQEAGYLFPGER
jgi:hypothetical protein